MAKIGITETVLRDAHQSLIATRMTTEDMLPILPELDEIGFRSIECWGGATFDACLRFLNEDPWERLRILKKNMPKTTRNSITGKGILRTKPLPMNLSNALPPNPDIGLPSVNIMVTPRNTVMVMRVAMNG